MLDFGQLSFAFVSEPFVSEPSDADIIAAFEKKKPKTIEEIESIGLTPRFINKGISRKVYRVSPRLAVKIEYTKKHQTANEIAVVRRIETDEALAPLRRHTLPVFYGDEEAGVILTKYYERKVPKTTASHIKQNHITEMLSEIGVYDMHDDNFRLDEDGTCVAIDIGFSY